MTANPQYHLFLEAKNPEAWQQAINQRIDHLKNTKDDAHLLWQQGHCKEDSCYRSYIAAESKEALIEALQNQQCPEPIKRHKSSIAFLATGQGSQYINMGHGMQQHMPVFKESMDVAIQALNPHLPAPLETLLYPQNEDEVAQNALNQTLYTQPALFGIEYAFARTWQSFGIQPDYCMGHSIGEFASAVVAGVMSLEEGAALITKRSTLMQSLPSKGSMAPMMMGHDPQIDDWLAQAQALGFALDIAAFNGPKQTVLSGDTEGIDQVLIWAKEAGVRGTKIPVSHAFHSSHMDPILDTFEDAAAKIDFQQPSQCQLISNRYGNIMQQIPNAAYWREHIRNPVRFHQGIQVLFDKKVEVFIEVGPHPVLIGMSKRCYSGENQPTWLCSAQKAHHDLDVFASSLSELFLRGHPIDAKQ